LTAVSTGAILSTYQRLRIEHVCSRLGLVSLAYLWQAQQLPLLEQMQACGMDVVLVKVAGVGLRKEMVGASLWDQLLTLRFLVGLQ
jgi:diphthine-ammonia ligase